MIKNIKNENPDVMVYCGDFGEILMNNDLSLIHELFFMIPTLFVLGNHDLYSTQDLNPVQAMSEALKVLKYGIPLQTHWSDSNTFYEKDDCLFLGTIGWPDFSHPKIVLPTKYLDQQFPTTDYTYINLRSGWLIYTDVLLKAFEKKLLLVNKNKCSNVVILSHYPCFESQYRLNPTDDISVCFYCHKLGELIKHTAENNPDKQFYCIAAHGHQYNINRWFDLTNNIKTFGFFGDYGLEKYDVLEI
jgi:predicted MPP superfamily phosphohydrolase